MWLHYLIPHIGFLHLNNCTGCSSAVGPGCARAAGRNSCSGWYVAQLAFAFRTRAAHTCKAQHAEYFHMAPPSTISSRDCGFGAAYDKMSIGCFRMVCFAFKHAACIMSTCQAYHMLAYRMSHIRYGGKKASRIAHLIPLNMKTCHCSDAWFPSHMLICRSIC